MKKKNLILAFCVLCLITSVSSCRKKEICAAYDRVEKTEIK